ncbi:hypothetical protein ACA910_013199 [Epithemia clementina (nom. ined.)]
MFFLTPHKKNKNKPETARSSSRKASRKKDHGASKMAKSASCRFPPSPPSRRPNIAERISMLQMATLNHTGYKPENGIPLALPLLPDGLSTGTSMTESTNGNGNNSNNKRESKNKKTKKIVKQRLRFVHRLRSRNRGDVPAEDVWIQLVQEGNPL